MLRVVRLNDQARLSALVAVLASSVLVIPVKLRAQAPYPEPGTRVRLTGACDAGPQPGGRSSRPGCSITGDFIRAQAGAVVITTSDSTSSIRLADVNRFEVSRGLRSHRVIGAAGGLLVGGAITFAVLNSGGSTSKCDRSANQDALSSRECLGLTVLGGAVVAGLGAIAGGFLRTERWEEIRMDRLRASIRLTNSSRVVVSLRL